MYIDLKSSYSNWRRFSLVVAIILVCSFVRCTDNHRPVSVVPAVDLGPAAVVSNLKIAGIAADRITISWTAPATNGEDLEYQIRHSEDSLTVANWLEGVVCPNVPPVADSGMTQSCDVTGLPAGKLSYIAIRIRSNSGGLGPLSENVSGTIPSLLTVPVSYSLSGDGISVSDFDSDGDIDIVIRKQTEDGDSLYVLHNNGTGRFAQSQVLSVAGSSSEVRSADINNDGFNDIVTLSSTHILMLTNDGTGYFSVTNFEWVGQMTKDLQVGDLNGDGFTDIIASASVYYGKFEGGSSSTTVYFNDGTGGFDDDDTLSQLPLIDICIFDADGDNDNDIAHTYGGSEQAVLLYNDGTGRSWVGEEVMCLDWTMGSVTPGDINKDGRLDLIAVSDALDQLAVATRNDQDDYTLKISTLGAGEGHDCHLGDFNGDGFLDVARAGYILTLHINDGEGGFSGAAIYPINTDNCLSDLEVADFNGDGHPDIAVVQNPGSLKVFFSLP